MPNDKAIIAERTILTSEQGNDYTLARFEGPQRAPYIRDLELAERLGFSKIYDIRQIISRHVKEGNLNDFRVFGAVPKTSKGGRPAREYWLSEGDALFIIAKSETATANQILKEVIAVYLSYRHGRLGDVEAISEQMVATVAQMVTTAVTRAVTDAVVGWVQTNVFPRIEALEQRSLLASKDTDRFTTMRHTETIREDDCKAIRDYVNRSILPHFPTESTTKARSTLYKKLADRIDAPSYRHCPRSRVGELWNELHAAEEWTILASSSGIEQLPLFRKGKKPILSA